MKAEDLDEQMKRPDYSPPAPSPAPYTSAGDALGYKKIDEAGMAYARKWKLVREDGSVKCINDRCDGHAQMPTLECLPCRRRRTGA